MLKVGFIGKRRDACWQIRCLTPMSYLNEKGHQADDEVFERQVHCIPCLEANRPGGPYEINYDITTPAICPGCQRTMFSQEEIDEWIANLNRVIEQSDILVFQRPTDLPHLRLMKKVKEMGKKVVQTCDDLYIPNKDGIGVPEWNTGFDYYSKRRHIIEETFRVCDAMDVTTPYLKEVYSDYCPNVQVLPNCQDIELIDSSPVMHNVPVHRPIKNPNYHPVTNPNKFNSLYVNPLEFQEMRKGKKLVIWGGSPTHEKDLEIIIGAVKRIAASQDVLFAFVGYVHHAIVDVLIPTNSIVLFSLVSVMQYFSLYKGINADIGLSPVVDVPFNHAKSSNKAIEYQILNILPVMSDLPTYRGCSPRGIYAKNDEYSWYTALRNAINLPDTERQERLLENRKFVEDHYDMKKNVVLWENFYESILAEKK